MNNYQQICERCLICSRYPEIKRVSKGYRLYGCSCSIVKCKCKTCVMTTQQYLQHTDSKLVCQFDGLRYEWQHEINEKLPLKILNKKIKLLKNDQS